MSPAARSPACLMASSSERMGVILLEPPQEELAVPRNDGQHVVEVVGHAPGQSPHRLHLLGLAKLGLELFELRHVLIVPNIRVGLPSSSIATSPWA